MGGGERFADGVKFMAKVAAHQDVTVVWEEYESMPHLWPMLFRYWPQAQRCWERWTDTCTAFATKAPVTTKGLRWKVGSLQCCCEIDVLGLTQLSVGDAQGYVRRHQANICPFTEKETAKASL